MELTLAFSDDEYELLRTAAAATGSFSVASYIKATVLAPLMPAQDGVLLDDIRPTLRAILDESDE